MTTSNRRPSTPFPATLPKAFQKEPGRKILQVDETCIDIFGLLPRFLENLLENDNLVCIATVETALTV